MTKGRRGRGVLRAKRVDRLKAEGCAERYEEVGGLVDKGDSRREDARPVCKWPKGRVAGYRRRRHPFAWLQGNE